MVSKEKFKVLAEANGWSQEHAKGFVDGQAYRKQGRKPSKYVIVGIDEYCRGFRAGYYERQDLAAVQISHSDIAASG